ncbi:efflux RND transporter periplasmic adaptor subunit [Bradyrhizobium sp.]|uniref:efflux RND transporter periplasmic adaptor subunit n=1 Tax=Bradyrhizobium sp. TaxID=376 RepID=UPI001ECEECEF|nr:efflux RND transporter periplasmic adaptor subunit [Bradyrhizobium sp.]MBV8920965.1 efflux RND transporter periplasmic adaptor subunit [Bradyrhizobium sp.]MBV9980659.1 efflux RND transporter periplasmic adaptor subunit [Bradyrhizobium sp.]
MRLFRDYPRAWGVLAIVCAIAGVFLVWTKLVVVPGASETTSGIRSPSAGSGQSAENDIPFVELSERQAVSIKVGPVQTREFEVYKTSIGAIDFNENMLVQVFSQYPGKILRAFYNVGDDIKQGDVLFTIDSPDLLQAESSLLASAGVLELQKKVLARATGLLKAGGSAQKDVDQATSDEQTAEGNFKSAKNAVRIFGKSDAEIEQILSDRKIDSTLVVPSPISGRVVTRNAAPGFLTQPGTAPAPFSIADISTMWMIANVIETDAPAYKAGQPVEVRVPAYPDRVFKGHVTTVGSTIDPTTHRQLVRSEVDDPEHLLRSGMYASFVIRVGNSAHSLAVPEGGVVREGDGTMTVWVTTDSRRFTKRTVQIGIRQGGWVQILDGLQPGETVVTEGAVFLSNKLLLGEAG